MPRSTRSPITFSYLLIALLLGLLVSLTACVGPAEAPPTAPADDSSAAQSEGNGAADEGQADLTANVENGETLHTTYCLGCHSRDGADAVGPSIVGLVPRAEETVASADYTGEADTAEGYIRESIVEPNVYVVDGYVQGVMPAYAQTLSAQELVDLVAYLMTYE